MGFVVDRMVLSESFGIFLSVSFHRCFIFNRKPSEGREKGSLETQFHRDSLTPLQQYQETPMTFDVKISSPFSVAYATVNNPSKFEALYYNFKHSNILR